MDIISVVYSHVTIDYDAYIEACDPIGCTEMQLNTNFIGTISAALVLPSIIYNWLRKPKEPLIACLKTRRKNRIKAQIVKLHNEKKGGRISELDAAFLKEECPFIFLQLDRYKREQVLKFPGSVEADVELTNGIMDNMETRGAEDVQSIESDTPVDLLSPHSPGFHRQPSSLSEDIASGLGKVASWITPSSKKVASISSQNSQSDHPHSIVELHEIKTEEKL